MAASFPHFWRRMALGCCLVSFLQCGICQTQEEVESYKLLYKQQFERLSRLYVKYPMDAVDKGLEGSVTILLAIDRDGKRSERLLGSSGDQIFVDAVLRNVKYAWVPIPPLLQGKAFDVEVTYKFSLQ